MLAACQPQARSDSLLTGTAGSPAMDITVLQVGAAAYQPSPGSTPSASDAAACQAWSLDAQETGSFLALSTVLPEGALHDFSWLPCTISGRMQAEGREWAFEINAAGTSIWRAGDETRLMGCRQRACEPFVILMPESLRD